MTPPPVVFRPLPAEAVLMFAAWLTTRREPVTLGSSHDAAPAGELVSEFNKAQGFEEVRDGFETFFTSVGT